MELKEKVKKAFDNVYGNEKNYKLIFLGEQQNTNYLHYIITKDFSSLVEFLVSEKGIFDAQTGHSSNLLRNKWELEDYLNFLNELEQSE